MEVWKSLLRSAARTDACPLVSAILQSGGCACPGCLAVKSPIEKSQSSQAGCTNLIGFMDMGPPPPLSFAGLQQSQEAEDFEIEPHEGNHQRKTAIPFHVLGRAGLGAALDGIKVEDQVQGCDHDHD